MMLQNANKNENSRKPSVHADVPLSKRTRCSQDDVPPLSTSVGRMQYAQKVKKNFLFEKDRQNEDNSTPTPHDDNPV
eukprot:14714121-Ditylum_brightwellii.AAC.1